MTVTIREFTGNDNDYKIGVKFWNKAWPEFPRTENVFRFNDSLRNPKYFFKRLIIEQNSCPIGVGEYMEEWESEDEDDYFMLFMIDPSADFEQAANSFFPTMMADLQSRNAKKVNTVIIEDRLIAKSYLEKNGYLFEQREPRSELDVQAFDFGRFAKLEEKLATEGIEIASQVELQDRFPDYLQRIYDLRWPIVQDIPTPFSIKQEPFEDFLKFFEHPNFMPESNFFALDGDQWVGLSNVKRVDGDPDYLSVGLTGVLPSHRRKGIAKALKLRTIAFAQKYGAKYIKTDNEENNPMFYLNLQLGFEPRPALLNYGLKIAQAQPKSTASAGLNFISFVIL